MIYFDHAATSPISREVLEAMWPYMTDTFANASSQHEMGKLANAGLEQARTQVAGVLGCPSREVVFTSGGTESNNLAIKGIALAAPRGRHIVTSPIEHEAVLETCRFLERFHGFSISYLEVDTNGVIDVESFHRLLRPDTTLCTVQYANNEIGTVQDLARIAQAVHEHGVPFHTDAVQAAGLLSLQVDVDFLSLSGHKFGGPKGVGVLRTNGAQPLEPLLHGGGQEYGTRSGTSNVAGAVGLAAALQLADSARQAETARLQTLRDCLIDGVLAAVPSAILTGDRESRLANHASFCFPGVSGEALLLELEAEGIACSSGSACAAGQDEPSYVLQAIGVSDEVAQTAVRFTFGQANTADEVAVALKAIPQALSRLS